MSTTPLGLIQNVRLPGREGLWQIAIEQGRFGGITPMGDTEDENVRILNARGGLAIGTVPDLVVARKGDVRPLPAFIPV